MEEEKPKAPEVVKVTSEKPKDPKKVEAGKKLAQISKQAKEKKKRERIMHESGNNFDDYYMYYIGAIGIVIASVSLYYAKKDSDALDKTLNEKKEEDAPEDKTVNIYYNGKKESRLEFL